MVFILLQQVHIHTVQPHRDTHNKAINNQAIHMENIHLHTQVKVSQSFHITVALSRRLIKVQKATTMCMYVAHWNIFMVNKRELKQNKTKQKKVHIHSINSHRSFSLFMLCGVSLFLKNERSRHMFLKSFYVSEIICCSSVLFCLEG